MKKYTLIFITMINLSLIGCVSSVPKPPKPKGALTPVNPTEIKLNDLKVRT